MLLVSDTKFYFNVVKVNKHITIALKQHWDTWETIVRTTLPMKYLLHSLDNIQYVLNDNDASFLLD